MELIDFINATAALIGAISALIAAGIAGLVAVRQHRMAKNVEAIKITVETNGNGHKSG
jgi:hypothetical protein